jgi:hypothetical protein
MMIRLGPVAVMLAVSSIALAQEANPDIIRVSKHLKFLAGDECQGRGLETKGILKAGEYIAEQFKSFGLKPGFESNYFQPFEVPAPSLLGTPQVLVFKNGDQKTEPKLQEGFVTTIASANGVTKAGIVFVGHGITSTTPDYDDYAGVDVKNKIVMILRRGPGGADPHGPFAEGSPLISLTAKLQNAIKHQAAGVIFINDSTMAEKTDPLMAPELTREVKLAGPVLHLKRDIVDSLLKEKKTTLAEIEKAIQKEGKPNSFELAGWAAEVEVTVTKRTWPTRNVVAVCDGAGPLADETIVIGAHYDHLGQGEPGGFERERGKTHYGADDNASGTTGLLELARRYGAIKNREGRRIVFVAFSGEEQGLYGSKYYCEHPVFPNEKTAFMLNMDMIGRMISTEDKSKSGEVVKKDRLVVYGTGTSTGLADCVQEMNQKFDFKLMTIPGGSGPSDHTSFYNKKIPVLFFFTGTHKDYHRPTDTPDRINTEGLLKVVAYVETLANHYATVKARPDFLKTKGGEEDPTDPNPRTGRVSIPKIKFTPGNYGEEDKGVLVEAVEDGGPAAKGGMKEGDFIIEVAGQPVKNMDGYMTALRTVVAEKPVEFVVLRKGEKVKLSLVPWK